MLSIAPGSAKIVVTQQPVSQAPAPAGQMMNFGCQEFRFRGEAALHGAASDNPTGWTLGTIQCEWIETNWGHYRGLVNNQGSLFVQRARPPARPHQACRDTLAGGAILVDNLGGAERFVVSAGAALPIPMSCRFMDAPNDSFPLQMLNPRTGQPNFLHESQLEFHFCTILTLRSPANQFQHLKHVYWNVHWQARFTPPAGAGAWGVHLVAHGNSAHVGHVHSGAPNDPRFTGVLTAPGASNCNAVANNAVFHPNIQASNHWENPVVTK